MTADGTGKGTRRLHVKIAQSNQDRLRAEIHED